MVAVPAAAPVTRPLLFTVATLVLSLLHVPPAVASLSCDVVPVVMVVLPVIDATVGAVFTVRLFEALTGAPQPLLTVYVILVVPAPTAVTRPVLAFTVATAVLLLLHVPPGAPLEVYVAVAFTQSGEVPLTVPADTFGFTVSVAKAETGDPQPLFTV